KNPDSESSPRLILDLRHQRTPTGGLASAVADYHGQILPAADAISDRMRTRNVVQAGLPQQLAARIVVSADHSVESTAEKDAARGRKRTGGLGRPLAVGPCDFSGHQIDSLQAAIL